VVGCVGGGVDSSSSGGSSSSSSQVGNHHKGCCGRRWMTTTVRMVTVLEVSKGRSRRRRGAGTAVAGSRAGGLGAVLEAGKKKW